MSDLISRQAAIDAIRASTKKYRGFMEMEMYTDDDAVEAVESLPSAQPEHIVKVINAQPTIEPERKRGKWIICTEAFEETFHTGCRCSVCNYWKPMGIWNFCPNCGAEMKGDQDE